MSFISLRCWISCKKTWAMLCAPKCSRACYRLIKIARALQNDMWDPSMFSWLLYCLLPDWGCVTSGKLPRFIFLTLPLENKGRAKPCFRQEKPVSAISSLVWSKCAFAIESVNCCCSPACGWASRVCSEVMENKAELRGPAGWLAGMCFPHPTCPGCGNKCLGSASGPECTWVSLPWGGALTCAEWRVYFMTWGVVRWDVSTQPGMVAAAA